MNAQEAPEIRVTAGANEIFIGESVDFQVEIRNSKNPSAPDLTAIKESFDVTVQGDESRNQSSTFIINGRVSQQNVLSHVYHFRLTPHETGDLTIPAVKATIDGKGLTSATLPLRVVAAEEQDLVLVEIEPSRIQVYPTQPYTVTLRILVRPLPNSDDTDPLQPLRRSPPHLQINWLDPVQGLPIPGLTPEEKNRWLQPLLARDGVGFTLNDVNTQSGSIFDGPRSAVFKIFKGREVRKGLDGDPIRYFVYELSRTLTPDKAATYALGPATVKGTFVADIERGEYVGKRLVAIAPAVTVEVRDVPTPRPASYCGGIGEYHISAEANPTKLRVGDPLTLTIELTRGPQSGSLELISAPDLTSIPQLTENFDLIDKNPTGRIEGSVKRFSYAMRPKHAGVSLPPISISTFDPKDAEFSETTTAPIMLEVTEAARVTGGDLVGTLPTSSQAEIKSRTEGIFQNITDPSGLRDERISLAAWAGAAVAVWCAAGVLIAATAAYRRRTSDPAWVRRQQARRAANRKLASARESLARNESQEALRLVRSAIVGLVADTRNQLAEGLTTADVAAVLTASSITSEDRDALLRLLESIESAEYGGGQSLDPALSIDSAGKLLMRIAPLLERGA